MSAIAGRVLILPKGDYDASVTYEFLDLVNHNSSSWLAKKASTGIEPSDANAEYWQKFGSSFTVDGETITIDENGVISAVGGTAEKVTYENESVEDVTNVKEALDGIIGDYLPLSGGTVTIDSYTGFRIKRNTTDNARVAGIMLGNNNDDYGGFACDGYGNYFAMDKNGSGKPLFHTGNKPTGTYTGNGSATSRTISTGGKGNTCILSSTNGMAIVTEGGASAISSTGSHSAISKSHLSFKDGELKVASTNIIFNANGVEVKYQIP